MPGHRLGQGTPYLLPRDDRLVWFTCRWTERVLRVSLPADLAPQDRQGVMTALASLEQALGLRFDASAPAETAHIVLVLGEPDAAKSGRTVADCAVSAGEGRLAAALVHAQVALQRSNESVLGKAVPLGPDEWLGALIHELGHALGFQGHLQSGAGPMVRNVEQVRAVGARVRRGETLEAPTLRALYALPSGSVLRRDRLPAGRTADLDRLAGLADAAGYRGPFVRVGDRAARLEWRHRSGRYVSAWLPGLARVVRSPGALEIVPDPLAAAWLAGLAPR
ncbi:MAG: hypothetical protein ACQGVC_03215 [Myxococcota bacterium]